MRYLVLSANGDKVGTIYAPNNETALERAVKEYGMDVSVEEI